MAEPNRFLLIFLLTPFSTLGMAAYSVVDFGARPDDRIDSADGFLRAWAKAFSSRRPVSIYVAQAVTLLARQRSLVHATILQVGS